MSVKELRGVSSSHCLGDVPLMRIRRRLALFGAVVTAAAMIVFGVLFSALGAVSAPADQEKQLETAARETLAALGGSSPAELASQPPPLMVVDPASSNDAYVAVYGADGRALYATARIGGEMPRVPAAVIVEALETGSSGATATLVPDVEVRVHALRWQQGDESPAVLLVGQSTGFVDEQLKGLGVLLWVAGIIALIAATIVGWLVSGRALRPLRDLAATTDEIARTGDLSRRLPEVKVADEVGLLTQSFNEMLARLEEGRLALGQALESQKRFVADASHELRSPLTTIRSNAGFLRDRPEVAPADRTEAIADIALEADRMSHLVDDLLILARGDAGQLATKIPVEFGQVVGELKRRAEALGSKVEMDIEGAVVVLGDTSALSRLAWVLIENAAVHGQGTVCVSVRRDESDAVLEVRDDGPGFDPDEMDRVFDRFYRADSARSPAGSGLGLAIAKSIVVDHGGSIAASNASGAVVTAHIPAVD